MTGSIIAVFIQVAGDKSTIGNGFLQYESIKQVIIQLLLFPLAYEIVFTVGWYLYFIKSRRCRDFVKRAAE